MGYTSSVYAVKSGSVLLTNSSGWGGGYGNYVVIDHGGGLTTLYAHMSSIKVSVGRLCRRGRPSASPETPAPPPARIFIMRSARLPPL